MASPIFAQAATQSGKVQSGETPIAFSTVTLYGAGTHQGIPAVALGAAQSAAGAFFNFSYTPPRGTNAVLYLIADGAPTYRGSKPVRSPIRLAAVLGTPPVSGRVVINERTTVASAYAMAQFIIGPHITGTAPGLQNASATVRNLVDLTTGQVGSVLGNPPNGLQTSTMSEFNTLADMLAACVNAPTVCPSFFALTTPPGGNAPRDTLQAVVNIAHYPWQNVKSLFDLSQSYPPIPYHPVLTSAPDAWTLAVKYIGTGREFDGPGNMAVDKQGNIWITNNYTFGSNPLEPVCGGTLLLELTPTGADAPGAPFSGGGVDGAGFGIGIDPKGNIWLGNFGFQGQGCTTPPPSNSVSKFSLAGKPLSSAAGFTEGNISSPQGTVSDQMGNIWIANCCNNTITQFLKGDPGNARIFANVGLNKPFDIAIDAKRNAWISSSGNDSVVALGPDGTPIAGSPFTGGGIKAPLGVAIDSLGNVWIANSGIISLPCPTADVPVSDVPTTLGGSVTLLRRDGRPPHSSPFTGGGLTIPWGIAVDGDDNIWVANFADQRLTQLCGARPSRCPQGSRTGDPISPSTGYTSDALDRNTGVAIDPSGNVWLANNWKNIPVQTNPGGDGLVVFIGLAAPVKTPLIGPPSHPYARPDTELLED
ncbi:MAG: NHL repeat-containing protein [Deltaproteobacteria bacterium]|nr:NHL repeat-containing protein [Deltaproteobacteria bacterium]